jgi:hypothetical protein
MNTTFLLVLLTLGNAGQISAAFVNEDSQSACQSKSKILGEVISASGAKIIKNRCIASQYQFSKFSHAESESEDAVRNSYLISLTEQGVHINQLKNKMECITDKEKMTLDDDNKVYCTTSRQQMISDE